MKVLPQVPQQRVQVQPQSPNQSNRPQVLSGQPRQEQFNNGVPIPLVLTDPEKQLEPLVRPDQQKQQERDAKNQGSEFDRFPSSESDMNNNQIGNFPVPGMNLYPSVARSLMFRADVSEPMENNQLDDYNPFSPNKPFNNGIEIPTQLNLVENQAKEYFEVYGNSAARAHQFCNIYRNTIHTSEYLQHYCNYITSNVQNSETF
ncbi:Hypothetical protein SRAE_X000056800 [Strongyloides ratti]|uniref:Uncharacterized protein n=1 Tax=Strongyloides ratti TaxID=34506 RepID=A0A090LND9_STRRB|nr:Hypothetical protein SRAE_X000056800 [Strongyloides ratti]CEF71241.1 Hypothetical protein SRAE_X000056800 [Strongyloides ratti]